MNVLGTPDRPLRVVVVGAGPSGFYTVEALLKSDLEVRVDVIDKLPTPYGLVRAGVAPDHQKIKSVASKYQQRAQDPRVRFFGHVSLGTDVTVDDLLGCYDMVVYAVGSPTGRELGVPGEDLEGVHSATEFVYWYNGHPDFAHHRFGLDGATRVGVVGNGNVAIDVARILIRDPEELAPTDIAWHALEALRRSKVTEVLLLGRRGPAQAAFSPKELKELSELDGVTLEVSQRDMDLDTVTLHWLEGDAPRNAKKNLGLLTPHVGAVAPPDGGRTLHLRFLTSPIALVGSEGRLTGVELVRNELYDRGGEPRPRSTDETWVEPIDLVFKAIGYRGIPLPGVPFHEAWGIIPNDGGRVTDGDVHAERQYCVGWAKRGPTGLIGDNSKCARDTVAVMLADVPALATADRDGDLPSRLASRGVRYVTFDEWLRIDAIEVQRGAERGRIRQKFVDVDEMLEAARAPEV